MALRLIIAELWLVYIWGSGEDRMMKHRLRYSAYARARGKMRIKYMVEAIMHVRSSRGKGCTPAGRVM